MWEYDRTDISEEIDVKKCIICNYYYLFKVNFRFQSEVSM